MSQILWPIGRIAARPKAWPYIINPPAPNSIILPVSFIRTHTRIDPPNNFSTPIVGVVAVTNSSTAIVGTGTMFTYQLFANQTIVINGNMYVINTITDDTHMTVFTPYTGTTAVAQTVLMDADDNWIMQASISVSNFAQMYTKQTFLTTSFTTYRDQFDFATTWLRKTPFNYSVQPVIKYYFNQVQQTVDSSIYYVDQQNQSAWTGIYLNEGQSWPSTDFRYQCISITFSAGWGASMTAIPFDLQIAMANHAAYLYMNRGDDYDANKSCEQFLPPNSRTIYDKYRILDLSGNDYSINFG